MAPIDEALAAIESLKPGKHFTYTEIAKRFGVSRSTLSRRARNKTQSMAQKLENQQILNATQEATLVQYIQDLSARGLPPTSHMIRNFASEIAGKYVGTCWPLRFIERHKLDLISRWTSGINASRRRADSAFKYALYFKLLAKKIEQYNVDARHIYIMDEKGFLNGILSKSKRVFSREQYERGKFKSMLQDGNREWITSIACICADGSTLTPALIYQAVSGNVQDTWL